MVEINTSPKNNSVCGTCVHFKSIPAFAEVCSKMGIGHYHAICEKYLFNWKLIDVHNKEQRVFLSKISNLPVEQLVLIADLLRAEKLTRGKGFKFKEPVYIKLFGDDYLSNYAKAWVIMAAGAYIYVQGKNSSYYGAFLKKSVIKEARFINIAAKLIDNNRLVDPKIKDYTKLKVKPKSLEDVPSIDALVSSTNSAKKESFNFVSNAYE
jgi:hypothetical protein